jgi:hypothetical protein
MRATSVKLSEEDKEKLEKLQALVTLKASGKMTQQELLSALIREALERSDELIDKMVRTTISDQGYEKILSLVDDWGVETSWEDVDKILYSQGAMRHRRKVGS